MSQGIPEAIGPMSKTVIGDSPSVATVLKLPTAKPTWKKWAIPVGILGAVFLAMRYKGHI